MSDFRQRLKNAGKKFILYVLRVSTNVPLEPIRTVKLQDKFEREERRAVIALGILAIVVTFRLQANPSSSTAIFLDLLIAFWVGYGLSMLIYFSDDLFTPGTRREAKWFGLTCLFEYPIFFSAYLIYQSLTSYLATYVPSPYPLVAAVITFFLLTRLFSPWLGRRIESAYQLEDERGKNNVSTDS